LSCLSSDFFTFLRRTKFLPFGEIALIAKYYSIICVKSTLFCNNPLSEKT